MTDLWGAIATAIVVIFALIGAGTVVFSVSKWVRLAWDTLRKLNETLTGAVEFLKEHRGDMAAISQFNQALNYASPEVQNSDQGQVPLPYAAMPGTAPGQYRTEMPTPVWENFRTQTPEKPVEPDAPNEPVDVSPREDELVDVDRVDHLRRMGFDAPDPDFKPKAVEVDSE